MRIIVGNSECRLEGFTREQFSGIRKKLSYMEQGRWRGQFTRYRRFLIDQRGNFPTGLLYLLEEYLTKKKIAYTLRDTRVKPSPHPNPPKMQALDFEPYPEQLVGAQAALEAGRGIVTAPTGVGKSLIAGLIIDAIKQPTLIVVPSLELKKQLIKSLAKMFGDENVGPLVRGKVKYFVTVENVDQLEAKKCKPAVHCVIIDEFHRSGAKTYRKLNKKQWDHVYYKFGLTATPFRSRSEERLLLESVLSKVIYKISYKTAVEKQYIVPMQVFYVELPKIKLKVPKDSNGRLNFHQVYQQLVVEREDRNEIIATLLKNLHEEKKSSLCLVKRLEHGVRLAQDSDCGIPFAEGANEDNEAVIRAFNAREMPVMIGTIGVLGEGIDTKPCEYVIMAGGGKSKNQFMQNVGRGARKFPGKESCKVIMFRDPSHKWMIEHFRECVKYLREEYDIEPVKLTLAQE